MKQLFCLAFFTGLVLVASAQSTRDSVIAAVNQLFTAMKNADTTLLKNSFSPNAVLQTIKEKDGVATVQDEKISEFVEVIGKETAGAADEQIKIESVKIDGPMATVWAPYKFYYKGNYSHCGVDAFLLVRVEGRWKIQYINDTRRKGDCL